MTAPTTFAPLFEAIDRKDVDGFVRHLAPDVRFTYGSRPTVQGVDLVRETVRAFFDGFASIEHQIDRVLECGPDIAVVEGRVTYHTKHGRAVTVPFVNLLELEDRAIRDYRIYVDPSPVAG